MNECYVQAEHVTYFMITLAVRHCTVVIYNNDNIIVKQPVQKRPAGRPSKRPAVPPEPS